MTNSESLGAAVDATAPLPIEFVAAAEPAVPEPPARRGAALRLSVLTSAAAILWAAGTAGVAYMAGPAAVLSRFAGLDWPFVALVVVGVVAAFAGYLLAYQAVAHPVAGTVSLLDRAAIVAAGLGGFVLTGGKTVDRYALRQAGMTRRQARVRVMVLHQLEQIPIALAAFAVSLAVIVEGMRGGPPASFVWPWALGVPTGAVVVLGARRLLGARYRGSPGWRGRIGIATESVDVLLGTFLRKSLRRPAGLGMTVYWLGELAAVWGALAAFGVRLSLPAALIGLATGYALTRRSAPLGGAGLIDILLPLSLFASGAPLSSAVAAVVLYRAFNLWMTVPPALVARSRVRRLVEAGNAPAGEEWEPALPSA